MAAAAVAVLAVVIGGLQPQVASAKRADGPAARRAPDVVPGRYIVTYKRTSASPGEETSQRERREGFRARFVYSRAVKGFSANLSSGQVSKLKTDPEVASVAPDRIVRATADLAAGEPTPPAGIRRMGAASSTSVRGRSGVNVAVIDTGVDLSHPDLNATTGKNCVTPGAQAQDDNGHGTHVSGTIAAKNDGAGVSGVAPGTKIYAAKVLGADGSGTSSQVICGIDWVTSTRTDGDPATTSPSRT